MSIKSLSKPEVSTPQLRAICIFLEVLMKKRKLSPKKGKGKFLAVLWREYGGIPGAGSCGWAFSVAVAPSVPIPTPAAANSVSPAFGRSLVCFIFKILPSLYKCTWRSISL